MASILNGLDAATQVMAANPALAQDVQEADLPCCEPRLKLQQKIQPADLMLCISYGYKGAGIAFL